MNLSKRFVSRCKLQTLKEFYVQSYLWTKLFGVLDSFVNLRKRKHQALSTLSVQKVTTFRRIIHSYLEKEECSHFVVQWLFRLLPSPLECSAYFNPPRTRWEMNYLFGQITRQTPGILRAGTPQGTRMAKCFTQFKGNACFQCFWHFNYFHATIEDFFYLFHP